MRNKNYPRTTEGLRELLFDELDLLREGKSDPSRARVTANLARQIIESIRVQVQFQKVLIDQAKEAKQVSLIGK